MLVPGWAPTATYKVKLALSNDPAQNPKGEQTRASGDKPTVLLVDDHPELFHQLAAILSDEYSVHVAASGSEALTLSGSISAQIVVADVVMPGLDGMGLLKALRESPLTRTVPVILLSGHAGDEARAQAFECGADGFLTKPFGVRELRARIKAALDGTRVRVALARREALAQAEEAATRERAQILESITDAFYALDRDWRFTYLNKRALDHFGRRREALLGRLIWDVYPATRGTTIQTQFELATQQHRSVTFEVPSPLSGRWIEVHAYPSDHGLAVSFEDIETRKRAVADREQLLQLERLAREEAERLSRMKDEFLATLSHELRTPLNAILGWASVLRRSDATDGDFERAVETIERNARLQATIISDLLDMSRIISGRIRLDLQPVQVQEVVRAAIDAIEPAARAKDLGIATNWGSSVVPVRADPERLQQVFWNLLSNAVKYTPERGRIHISLEQLDTRVEVRIEDSGCGITPEFLPHVFDRFRQADSSTTRRAGGLGLGLSIVKSLVELHGGAVQVESEGKNQGSTFVVRLPVAAHQSGSTGTHRIAIEAASEAQPAQLPGTRVLVVDDDADARELISRMLRDRGASVRVASSGQEALRVLDAERFDVLLSDISMPVMDGYEFISRVRQLPPGAAGRMPAVALTACVQPSDRERARAAGFQEHVAKPVDPVQLIATIAALESRRTDMAGPV